MGTGESLAALDRLGRAGRTGERVTIAKLEKEYGVNRRTATRDLECLEALIHSDLQVEMLDDGITKVFSVLPDQKRVHVRYKLKDLVVLFPRPAACMCSGPGPKVQSALICLGAHG